MQHSPLQSVLPFTKLTNLTYLNIPTMTAPSDTDVQTALVTSGIGAKLKTRVTNAKYEYLFTAVASVLDLSYGSINKKLTSTSQEFINLLNRTNVTKLNLANQTELTNTDLQNTLKTMTGLKSLILYGCSGLTSINFVKSGNLKNLNELDIRYVGSSLTDISDLWIKDSSLVTLLVSNPDISFIGMNSFFKRAFESTINGQGNVTGWGRTYWWEGRGLIIENPSEAKTITITDSDLKYWCSVYSTAISNITFDLNSTGLEKMSVHYNKSSYVLPTSLEYLFMGGTIYMNLSSCARLGDLRLDNVGLTDATSALGTLPFNNNVTTFYSHKVHGNLGTLLGSFNCSNIEVLILQTDQAYNYDFSNVPFDKLTRCHELTLNVMYASDSQDLDLSKMNSLTKLSISASTTQMTINSLKIPSSITSICIQNTNLTTVSGLENLTNLTSCCLIKNNFSSLSFITNSKNITGSPRVGAESWLELQYNNFSDLSPLLQTIKNNSITYEKLDLSNNTTLVATTTSGVDNIDIIRQLHTAGLKKLNITGCTNITNTSKPECQAYIAELQGIFCNEGDQLIY